MERKIIALAAFIIILSTIKNGVAQNVKSFEKDFQILSQSHFDSSKVDGFMKTYSTLLTPFNQVTQFAMGIKGEKWTKFPLEGIKSKQIYSGKIDELLASATSNNRLLAYLMIASSGDTARKEALGQKMQTETSPICSLWLGMGLMYLGYDQTSKLFPWMVKNNTQAGGFLFPMFTSLPADSLRNTAYQFASGTDWNERIYAIQLLMKTGYSIQADTILREAIKNWPVNLKGYAIIPAQNLQIGKLLPLLQPLLDSTLTKVAVLKALADSPTESDRLFVVKRMDKTNPDPIVLTALKSSRYPEMIKQWLSQLQSDKLPVAYYFSVYQDTLLKSDIMLPFVQETIKKIKNPKILSQLIPALNGRNDQVSQDLLLNFLRDKNSSVRYYASGALMGTCSEKLKLILKEVAGDTNYCASNTFDLAIGCKMDSLQSAAEFIYASGLEHMTIVNALNYLANYPAKRHLKLFRNVLIQNDPNDISSKRFAAKGLAELHDVTSVETIINASENERKGSDGNTVFYIEALAKLKGVKAKVYVSTFLNSKEEQMRMLAERLIKNW